MIGERLNNAINEQIKNELESYYIYLSMAAWLHSRSLDGMVDPETDVLAVPGTREGLFFAALANTSADHADAVLIPNPCYHVYYSATAAAGVEPVFVSATAETGFQPDYTALDPALLDRVSLAYYCTPSNPQGAIADLDQLKALIRLARKHDFTVAIDECYAEIYTEAPPPGALQAAVALGGALDNLLVFHSLSKRSSAPGLRCGFAAGDAKRIEALAVMMSTGGAGVPLPVCAAGARLWREEDHARANRACYQENFAIAERVPATASISANPAAGSSCGSRSATARRQRSSCGARPASRCCPAPICAKALAARAAQTTRKIPARLISGSR